MASLAWPPLLGFSWMLTPQAPQLSVRDQHVAHRVRPMSSALVDDEAVAAFARDGVVCLRQVLDAAEVAVAACARPPRLPLPHPAPPPHPAPALPARRPPPRPAPLAHQPALRNPPHRTPRRRPHGPPP